MKNKKEENMCISREELNQVMNECLEKTTEKLKMSQIETTGLFNVIDTKLDYIKEQTTKTNNRVNQLETNIIEVDRRVDSYYRNCQSEPRIRALEDSALSIEAIKSFAFKFGLILVGSISIIFALFQLIL